MSVTKKIQEKIRNDERFEAFIDDALVGVNLSYKALVLENDKLRLPKAGDTTPTHWTIHESANINNRLDLCFDAASDFSGDGLALIFDTTKTQKEIIDYIKTGGDLSVNVNGEVELGAGGVFAVYLQDVIVDKEGTTVPDYSTNLSVAKTTNLNDYEVTQSRDAVVGLFKAS